MIDPDLVEHHITYHSTPLLDSDRMSETMILQALDDDDDDDDDGGDGGADLASSVPRRRP